MVLDEGIVPDCRCTDRYGPLISDVVVNLSGHYLARLHL